MRGVRVRGRDPDVVGHKQATSDEPTVFGRHAGEHERHEVEWTAQGVDRWTGGRDERGTRRLLALKVRPAQTQPRVHAGCLEARRPACCVYGDINTLYRCSET